MLNNPIHPLRDHQFAQFQGENAHISKIRGAQPQRSNRYAHISRLHDLLILQLTTLTPSPENTVRTLRTWKLLSQCQEVGLDRIWKLGSLVIERSRTELVTGDSDSDRIRRNKLKANWIQQSQIIPNQSTANKLDNFIELILARIAAGELQVCVELLDTQLLSPPFDESITLHLLAGQLRLFLAKESADKDRSTSSHSNSFSAHSRRNDQDGDSTMEDDSRDDDDLIPIDGEKDGKQKELDDEDHSLVQLLAHLKLEQPTLFSSAIENFRQAANLENKFAASAAKDESTEGQAIKWVQLLERA